jgi:primary-amine oxidase
MKSFSLLLVILLLAQAPAPRVQPSQTAGPVHRLDPLSAAEITLVTDALSKAGRMPASVRVVTIELSEPDKAARSQSRAGRAVLYDWSSAVTTEMTVDLQSRAVSAPTTVATGDPPVRRVVIDRATEIAVGDRRVVQALARHGVTDLNRITFLGGLGEGTRLPRRGASVPLVVSPRGWDPIGNGMEVRGVDVRVDLAAGTVEEVLESPVFGGARVEPQVPLPPPGRPLRPLVISQPNGHSYSIRGSEILWDRWRIHFGVHPRRGIEIYDVAILDGKETRPVLYRAGLSELMTPYGDPEYVSWYPRDAGDYGMSLYSATRASAIVGSDAPANATFVPAIFPDPKGRPVTVPRVVAIYERDGGVLWRHSNRSMRSRQLVLSGYTTVDNYDYLFHWIFSQDGAIDVQVQLTGVMNVRPVAAMRDAAHGDDETMFGHLVAPRVRAPNHQHFFNWRIDLDVDGDSNRVFEMNTSNAQAQLKDRVGEWFGMRQTTLKSEVAARRDLDLSTARRWVVASASKMNDLGQHTAYALIPGENAPSFQAPGSAPRRRASLLEHQLWVTLFDPRQMYASGEWVNLMREREGVEMWSADDRPIVDKDVVLWYTNSVLHLPRPEDWPVMPAHTAGFRLVPIGFWATNPTGPAK